MESVTDVTRSDGGVVSRATVGALEVFRLRFPPAFSHGVVDPPRGYLAFVLDGAVCKSFGRSQTALSRGSFASIPAGAAHSSAFGENGCTVLVIRSATGDTDGVLTPLVTRQDEARSDASTLLGHRLARELDSRDAYSELAVEGLALELLACAGRSVELDDGGGRWLDTVRELIHESSPRVPTLHELGTAVERHPAQVGRAFRRKLGMSVTAYARMLRLERATHAVASTDDPLARIAIDAGFADQSHFTRSFKRHHGLTPGRYRRARRT